MPHQAIRIGISSCLLGEKVRYDGGHKRDLFIADTLSQYFEWEPVCPEAMVGMGVPRETVQLRQLHSEIKMVGLKTQRDWTRSMNQFSLQKSRYLSERNICGYIFKKGSPSCGLFRVNVYTENNMPQKSGRGLFAEAVAQHMPLLPVEEEGRLQDPVLRENFITRVFAYYRLNTLTQEKPPLKRIIEFHTRHKYLLMAHSPSHYKSLGQLVAQVKTIPYTNFISEYSVQFMTALSFKSTPSKNENVLNHLLGYFKTLLNSEDRKDIADTIIAYKNGLLPLVVPITLISHYVRKFKIQYLLHQYYLSPHPKELMLRNHV